MAIKSGETTYHQAKRGIVQNGLVFNVDFGVKDCYISGSSCSSLNNGITGVLQNNPSFDKDKGGSVFNAGDSNDNRIFNFDIRNNGTLVGHKISNVSYWTDVSTPPNDNQWNIVGSTYGSSSLKLWLNNQNLSSRTIGSPTGPTSDRVWLGRWVGSTAYPFKGYVSQVLIYNRALTATEVLQNYNVTRHRFGV